MRASALLLGFCAPALLAGCPAKNIGPNVRVVVSGAAASPGSGVCSTALEGDLSSLSNNNVLRLTFRVKDSSGNTIKLCDYVGKGNVAVPQLTIPYQAGQTIDLFTEAFGTDPASQNIIRVASGSALDQGPLTSTSMPLETRIQAAEAFRCVAGAKAKLAHGRAFHTATVLPNGQILFVGGLTTSATDNSGTRDDSYFIASNNNNLPTIELYDPLTRSVIPVTDVGAAMNPRAFHHAAIIGMEGTTKVSILLVGGITTSAPGAKVMGLQQNIGAAGTFRFGITAASGFKEAPAEILTVDLSDPAKPAVMRAPAMLPATSFHSTAFEGGAELPMGGIAVAGGETLGSLGMMSNFVDMTRNGTSSVSGPLDVARLGPGMVAIDANHALVIGGDNDMPSPFLQLDLSTTPITVGVLKPAAGGMFPPMVFPTVTRISSNPEVVLVSGGLAVVPTVMGKAGSAFQPAGTLPMLLTGGTAGTLSVATASANNAPLKCGGDKMHYRATAFDAATLIVNNLGNGDRVLITGGTPRNDAGSNCQDCENSDNVNSCATSQAVVYDVDNKSIAPNPGSLPMTATPEPLQIARYGHTISPLPDGTFLVSGGFTRVAGATVGVTDFEIYNPARQSVKIDSATGIDVDDPVAGDLKTNGWTRAPAALAQNGGKPAMTCALLQ